MEQEDQGREPLVKTILLSTEGQGLYLVGLKNPVSKETALRELCFVREGVTVTSAVLFSERYALSDLLEQIRWEPDLKDAPGYIDYVSFSGKRQS